MRRGHLLVGALIVITGVVGSVAVVQRSGEPPVGSALPCPRHDIEFSRLSTAYPPAEVGPGPAFPRLVRLADAAVIGVVREVTTRWNLPRGERYSFFKEYRHPAVYRRVDVTVQRWLHPSTEPRRAVTLILAGGTKSFRFTPAEIRALREAGTIPKGERRRRGTHHESWAVHFEEGEPVALLLFRWSFSFATGEREVLTTSAPGKYLIDAGCRLRNPMIRFAGRWVRLEAPRTLSEFVAAVREHAGGATGP